MLEAREPYLPVCGASLVPSLPPRLPSGLLLALPLADEPAAEAPDASEDFFSFLAFLDFFAAFGFSSVAVVASVPEAPEVAAGEEEVPLPVALGLVVEEPEVVPVVPDAPVPLVPEAPDEVSPLPAAPLDGVLLLPDEVDGLVVLDGMVLELPLELLPVAPGVLCEGVVDEGDVSLLPLAAPLCASAMEDTDATTTNDSERRVVFNVMSNSLLLKKGHHRCSSLDARPARAFSNLHDRPPAKPLKFS